MRSRDDVFPPEPNIAAFLTDLAVHGHVAAATQNQAMNALVFLDTRVLNHAMQGHINAARADKKINVPVVMTREEVASVVSLLGGTAQLVATRLDGSGLRIMEAVRLRGQDIDVQMKPRTVRAGQGDKDRFTTVRATLTPWLQNHRAGVRTLHSQDVAQGHGEAALPPCAGAEVSPCPQGVGLAVSLPRPEARRSPSVWCHTPSSCCPQRHQQSPQGGGPPCRSEGAYQSVADAFDLQGAEATQR